MCSMVSGRLTKSNSAAPDAGFQLPDLKSIPRPGEELAFGVKSPVFQWVCATDNGSRRAKRFFILEIAFSPVCMDSFFMTPIHAKGASTEKYGDQSRLIVDLVPSEFLGPFERLRFKRNPYCGSFSTSLSRN